MTAPFSGLGFVVWRADKLDVGPDRPELERLLHRTLEPLGWVVAGALPVSAPERFLIAMDDWNRMVRYEHEGEVRLPVIDVRDVSEYAREEDPRDGETTGNYEEGKLP